MMNIASPLVMLIAILILLAAVLFTQVAPALVTYRRRILSGEDPMIEHDDRRSDQIATTVDKPTTADVVERVSQSERADRMPAAIREDRPEQLFASADAQELRSRWAAIQSSFVDEPRSAVEAADKLVDDAMKRLAQRFADERKAIKGQLAGGEDVSTENLRLILRRSRQFLDRLLSL